MDTRPPALDFSGMLPDRPITVRPPRTVGGLSAFGMFSVLFLLACIVWTLVGADVVRDWRIGADPVAAADARVDEAHCRTWLFVFGLCSVSATDTQAAAEHKLTFRYAFLGRESAEPITLLRSRNDPALLTTDLGRRHLNGRTLVLLLLTGVLLGAIAAIASVVHSANRTRQGFAALSRQQLEPTLVEMERNNALPPRRRVWIYRYANSKGSNTAMVELHSRIRPIFVTKDERWAMAVRGPEGTVPMLLDGNLDSLDLAHDEKVVFLEKCRAELEKRGLI
jgi:hypothetical protein